MIGCCIHILLTGITLSMMTRFVMAGRFKREPRWMRLLVAATFSLTLVHLGLACAEICYWASTQDRTELRFLKGTYVDSAMPLVVSWIAVMVQGVYGWRAWSLMKNVWAKRVFVGLLAPVMLTAFLAGAITSALDYALTGKDLLVGSKDSIILSPLWLWCSVVTLAVDVGLSITLAVLFRSNVAGFNRELDSVLMRLAKLAIQSGSYTAVNAFVGAVCSHAFGTNWHIAFIIFMFLPGLYTISLFVTLNAEYSFNQSLQPTRGLPTFGEGSVGERSKEVGNVVTHRSNSRSAFIVSHGLHGAADFVFILNGHTDLDQYIPEADNIRFVKRSNTCYDMGSYGEVLNANDQELVKKYSHFILINASIRGPFVPHWSQECWSSAYLNRLNEKVKMVGMTMNCVNYGNTIQPHVQSMILALDRVGLELLLVPNGLSDCPTNYADAVGIETAATDHILDAGYEVDVMMQEFHRISFAQQMALCIHGDFLWDGNYGGANIHPYETLFAKTKRGIAEELLDRLTEWTDGDGYSSWEHKGAFSSSNKRLG
ncbi:hypothetical protein MNV49_001726 [Pseudohyphozyma bogoriensis]|nr:hypothetical protein MNV49_001726 [Pseudohyphozyma bogoriensis]